MPVASREKHHGQEYLPMPHTELLMRLITCCLLLVICLLNLGAQDMSALINEALDKRIDKLDLTGTLPQVINTIGDRTGVKIVATAAVWDLLPWGQSTNINAHIENQTL